MGVFFCSTINHNHVDLRAQNVDELSKIGSVPPADSYMHTCICIERSTISVIKAMGTSHPGLSLLPYANFFFALNRSHHFLLKKSEFYRAT